MRTFFISLVLVCLVYGNFIPHQSLPGRYGIGGALSDINNDGDLDLIVGNYGDISIYLNENGCFSYRNSLYEGRCHVATGDLNGDGFVDLVARGSNSAVRVFLNDSHGGFRPGQAFGQGVPFRLYLVDFNQDGKLDLLQCSYWATLPAVYFGQGDGTFFLSQTFPDDNCLAAAIADFDGNGNLDIAFGRWPDRPDKVYFNNGAGYFIDSGQNLGNFGTFDIAAGDLDGDGDVDLVAGADDCGYEPSKVWNNNGQGSFSLSPVGLGYYYTHVIKLRDIDGDNDLDVFEGNTGVGFDSRERLYLNNGSATAFEEVVITHRYTFTNELLLGDINGDTVFDLIDIGYFNQSATDPESIYVYLSDGMLGVTEKMKSSISPSLVFPNPVLSKLEIRLSNPCPNKQIFPIIDITGKVIDKIEIPPYQMTGYWENKRIPAGIYFLLTQNRNEIKIVKIVKVE